MTPSEKLFELARGPMIDEKHNCKKEKEEFFKLLSQGADVNYINPKGYFELDSQYREDCLFCAVTNHNYYLASLLLKHGAKYDNSLYGYCEHGYNVLGALYDIFSFDYFDEKDKSQAKVLFNYVFDKAVRDNNYEAIMTLYEHHSSLPKEYFEKILSVDNGICFYKNEVGTTFLELAVDNEDIDIIKLLIQNGAKANNEIIENYKSYKNFMKENQDKYILNLLHDNLEDEQTM